MATSKAYKQKIPKTIMALSYLIDGSMNKLEALSLYGDTCLNTTISELSNYQGFKFIRTSEVHYRKGGGRTHFTRYRLAEKDRERAIKMVYKYWSDNGQQG